MSSSLHTLQTLTRPPLGCAAAEAATNIQQVWLNCAAFNEDGSEMFEAGRAAEAELAAMFVAAGLPTPGDVTAKWRRSTSKRVNSITYLER
jgi:hypothetical protein